MVAYAMSAKRLVDKYYGPGGKYHKKAVRKARKEGEMIKAVAVKVAEAKPKKATRASLLAEAKAKKIEWRNAMTKDELEQALDMHVNAGDGKLKEFCEKIGRRWLEAQK